MRRWKRNGLKMLSAALLLAGSGIIAPLPGSASVVYAAQRETAVEEKPNVGLSRDDPNYYTKRVQEILNEYHTLSDAARPRPATEKPEQYSAPEPAAPEPEEPSFSSSERMDYDWQGTPIASSLYAVGKAAGKNIVINGKLNGNVYMSLHGVTCEQALDALAWAFRFGWTIKDDMIVIGIDEDLLQSKTIRLQHISGTEAAEEAKALGIDEDHVYANSETGTVSVTGTAYQVSEAVRRIRAIDHPISQCLVLAQIIEISHGKSLDLGMTYSLPTYSHTGTTSGRTTSDSFHGNLLEKLTFSSTYKASKELSKGHIIARPMTMMLNGQEGTVNFSDRVPIMSTTTTTTSTDISVTYEDVGTVLKIVPSINDKAGDVSMKIEVEVSNISGWKTFASTEAPQISKRKATTSAHLKSGQSFVIGGLMSATEMDNLVGIPGLMDLPILGKLFSYHSKSKSYSEVYIMITPYIVTENIDPALIMRKVGE